MRIAAKKGILRPRSRRQTSKTINRHSYLFPAVLLHVVQEATGVRQPERDVLEVLVVLLNVANKWVTSAVHRAVDTLTLVRQIRSGSICRSWSTGQLYLSHYIVLVENH